MSATVAPYIVSFSAMLMAGLSALTLRFAVNRLDSMTSTPLPRDAATGSSQTRAAESVARTGAHPIAAA